MAMAQTSAPGAAPEAPRETLYHPKQRPTDLTEAEWIKAKPLLPRAAPNRRTPVRVLVNATLYRLENNLPLRALPPDFPPWGSVHAFEEQLKRDGVWPRVLVAIGRDRLLPALEKLMRLRPTAARLSLATSGRVLGHRVLGRTVRLSHAGEPEHKGCLLVTLPPALAAAVLAFASQIPEEELDPNEGRETCPHVTVLYGLADEDEKDVARELARTPPALLALGKLSVFENPERDVLHIEVDSDDLKKLNARLAADLEVKQKYPSYQPHVTVAYLKKGKGGKYNGLADFSGTTASCGRAVFSPGGDGDDCLLPFAGERTAKMSLSAVRKNPKCPSCGGRWTHRKKGKKQAARCLSCKHEFGEDEPVRFAVATAKAPGSIHPLPTDDDPTVPPPLRKFSASDKATVRPRQGVKPRRDLEADFGVVPAYRPSHEEVMKAFEAPPPTFAELNDPRSRRVARRNSLNAVIHVTLPDGRRYYLKETGKRFGEGGERKDAEGPLGEYAAVAEPHVEAFTANALRSLGFKNVPPHHVLKDDQGRVRGILTPDVGGEPLYRHVIQTGDYPPEHGVHPDARAKIAAQHPPQAVSDWLAATWLLNADDRHEANYLAGPEGHVYPIDFGHSLHPYQDDLVGQMQKGRFVGGPWKANHDALLGLGFAKPSDEVSRQTLARLAEQGKGLPEQLRLQFAEAGVPQEYTEKAAATLAKRLETARQLANKRRFLRRFLGLGKVRLADLPEEHRFPYGVAGVRGYWVHK